LSTQLSDLRGGSGIVPGQIAVTLSSPATTATIDLSHAKSIGDLKDLIENALGAANVTVSVNPAKNGVVITPTAGTITIADVPGGTTAADFGITGSAVASIDSGDLGPAPPSRRSSPTSTAAQGSARRRGTGSLSPTATRPAWSTFLCLTVEDLAICSPSICTWRWASMRPGTAWRFPVA
jgi:hypothetical protein